MRRDFGGRGVCFLATPYHSSFIPHISANCFEMVGRKLGYPAANAFGLPTQIARNQLAVDILKNQDAELIFFIDSDMVFSEKHVREIASICRNKAQDEAERAQAEGDKPRGAVVAGLYPIRHPPYIPAVRGPEGTIERIDEAIAAGGALIEVDGAGTGFMCIHRDTFDALSFPWFEWPIFEDLSTISDDYWFCARVRHELGLPIWLNTGVRLGHVGEKIATYQDWLELKDVPRWADHVAKISEITLAELFMKKKVGDIPHKAEEG